MNTRLFSAISAAAFLALGVSAAHASMGSCKASLVSSGDRESGIRFEMSDTFSGIPSAAAFNRVYRAASENYQVIGSDREAGTISATEVPQNQIKGLLGAYLQTSDTTSHMTFTVDGRHGSSKVILVIRVRPGLKVTSMKPDAYCEVIEAAAGE